MPLIEVDIGDGMSDVLTGGGRKCFTTAASDPSVPSVETQDAYSIRSSRAFIGLNLTSDGGSTVLRKGMILSEVETDPLQLDDDSWTIEIGSSGYGGDYVVDDLKPGTTYYYRAFAENEAGVGYGDIKSFTTRRVPTISTVQDQVGLKNETIVPLVFTITNPEYDDKVGYDYSDIEIGYAFENKEDPGIIDDGGITVVQDGATITMTIVPVTNRTGSATVYLSIENDDGEEASASFEVTVKEPIPPSVPKVSTEIASGIGLNNATISLSVIDDGGHEITRKGMLISTSLSDSFELDKTSWIVDEETDNNLGRYSYRLTNLKPDTLYFYRAFAKSDEGIGYGVIRYLKTAALPPVTSSTPSPAPSQVTIIVSDPSHGGVDVNKPITSNIGSNLGLTGEIFSTDGKPLNLANIQIDADGKMTLPNIPAGEYKIMLYVVAPTGEKLAGRAAKLIIDRNGNVKLEAELIDPYGVITDQYTGKAVPGVKVTLHWADTELNRANGRTPGDLVALPILPDFAPNQNHDPQYSDSTGSYGWMVFPNADYYIIGEKEGYETFDSRTDTREETQGDDSYIRNGNIHVGSSIVEYDFKMKPAAVGSGEHQSYMRGYPDGSFRPDNGITRAEITAILTRLFPVKSSLPAVKSFSDVKPTHWAAQSIAVAAQQQWVKGYASGAFKPEQKITRAEMAQILYNINKWEPTQTIAFTDISGHWAEQAIAAAEKQGLLTGFADGTFRPDQMITRSETVVIMNKLLGRRPLYIVTGAKWTDVDATRVDYKDIMEASVNHSYLKLRDGSEVWTGTSASTKDNTINSWVMEGTTNKSQ